MSGPIVHWRIMRKRYWLAVVLAAPTAGLAQPPTGARQAFEKVCGACHSLETVTSQRRTRPQWQESIASMVARGAKGTEEELALILDYLTVQYGPAPTTATAAVAPPGGRGGRGAAF